MCLSSFLRTVLKLDAASCLAMAAIFVLGSGPLSGLLGIPKAMLTEAGILLAIVGTFILWLGTRERALPLLVFLVVVGNLGWVAASLATLALVPALTTFGGASILTQAVAVLVFAALEWLGLRKSSAVAPA